MTVRFVLALAMTISFAAVLALSVPLSGTFSLPISWPDPGQTAPAASPQSSRLGALTGVARVTDGDTLRIGAQSVRVNGIAAPERHEPGGSEATRYMRALVEGAEVTCADTGARTYGRIVAACRLADGRDVGAAMVEGGHARDCARYSGGRYAAAEQRARSNGRDLSKTYALPGYC